MYKKAALLTWILGFALAELIGIGLSYLVYMQGIAKTFSRFISDIVIVGTRFLFLAYIAEMCSISLSNAIYKPFLLRRHLPLLLITVTFVAILDYSVTIIAMGAYGPQLLGYGYYAEHGMLWGFPFKVAYYFSEIVVMNYMYILAKRAWSFPKSPITAGTLFLILGWAIPHIFTKDVMVALYAVALVILFYTGYEYTKSPITPIILWFTVLIV